MTRGSSFNERKVKIYHWKSLTKIYEFKTELEIAELSFSVVELEEGTFQHDVSVIILDTELRIHYITNRAGFNDKDQILPLYAKQDLYDKEAVNHAFSLKVDLAPRLNIDQNNFLFVYFERSKDMQVSTYQRLALQFNVSKEEFIKDEKLIATQFDLDEE